MLNQNQKINTLWRWEQDGRGGEHGTATYFPHTPNEVTVTMNNFKEANKLWHSIEQVIGHTRWDARAGLLAEIARIRP